MCLNGCDTTDTLQPHRLALYIGEGGNPTPTGESERNALRCKKKGARKKKKSERWEENGIASSAFSLLGCGRARFFPRQSWSSRSDMDTFVICNVASIFIWSRSQSFRRLSLRKNHLRFSMGVLDEACADPLLRGLYCFGLQLATNFRGRRFMKEDQKKMKKKNISERVKKERNIEQGHSVGSAIVSVINQSEKMIIKVGHTDNYFLVIRTLLFSNKICGFRP